MTAKQYITDLNLVPHREGGYYKQTYYSSEILPATGLPARFNGDRPVSTGIYYLLEKGDFSTFHKIKSDECWHFYAGDAVVIHMIQQDGEYLQAKLGHRLKEGETFQYVVPAGVWFAVEPAPESEFALTGCTVAPGFSFEDFEIGTKELLLSKFPNHHEVIDRLVR